MAETDDVTRGGANPTDKQKVLQTIEVLGVSCQNGTANWNDSDLLLLAIGLAKVPAFDRNALRGLVIVRDRDLGGATIGLSHSANANDASRCSRVDLPSAAHMHLGDRAFTLNEPLWLQFTKSKTVVHEAGHVRTVVRVDAANKALNAALDTSEAAYQAAVAAVNAVPLSPTDQRLNDFHNKKLVPYWSGSFEPASALVSTASNAVFRTVYPSPPNPDPAPAAWAQTIAGLRAHCLNAQRAVDTAVRELTTTATSLRALLDEKPARKSDPAAIGCSDAIKAINLALRQLGAVVSATVLAGAQRRQIEYFVWKMAHLTWDGRPASAFTPFNAYGGTAYVEWFAEAYALAAVNPGKLAELSPAAAKWFADGLPGLPTDLEPLV